MNDVRPGQLWRLSFKLNNVDDGWVLLLVLAVHNEHSIATIVMKDSGRAVARWDTGETRNWTLGRCNTLISSMHRYDIVQDV